MKRHNSRITLVALLLLVFLPASPALSADKFDVSLPSDIKIQSPPEIQPPAVPQLPKVSSGATLIPPTPILPQAPILPSAGGVSQVTVPKMQQLKITAHNYDEEYNKLFGPKIAAKKTKIKTLMERILDEFVRYGFHIGLALVVIILFYALRKDKQTPGTGLRFPGQVSPKKKKPDGKIWHDDF